ncbi:MAG: DUF937 domain-containing protein [Rhizobiales bacterium]|nr:DUF937 domain-containing protein [Hyphomicrobiales bacterium]
MNLQDILTGMLNGPRGQPDPSPKSSGGMSPLMMALLGLLAYKAVKHYSGSASPQTAPQSPQLPTTNAAADGGGGLGGLLSGGGLGNLGSLLPGGLGGLLAGGAAGGILSSGLDDLLKQFQQSGHGDAASSWVGKGENASLSPSDLEKALSPDQINMMTEHSGLSRDELLDGLSKLLPQAVDEMTPEGRLPTEQEMLRRA